MSDVVVNVSTGRPADLRLLKAGKTYYFSDGYSNYPIIFQGWNGTKYKFRMKDSKVEFNVAPYDLKQIKDTSPQAQWRTDP